MEADLCPSTYTYTALKISFESIAINYYLFSALLFDAIPQNLTMLNPHNAKSSNPQNLQICNESRIIPKMFFTIQCW